MSTNGFSEIKRSTVLFCSTGCGLKCRAEVMSNRPIDGRQLATISDHELAQFVLCPQCAALEETGGVQLYRFEATMRQVVGSRRRAAEAGQRLEQRRSDATNYAVRYGNYEGGEIPFVEPRPNPVKRDACGLPIKCCDHDQPTERYLVVGTRVVGICKLAAEQFVLVRGLERLKHPDRLESYEQGEAHQRAALARTDSAALRLGRDKSAAGAAV